MTTAMKSLAEMTNVELTILKADASTKISQVIRAGGDPAELVRFEQAIDDELDRRGF